MGKLKIVNKEFLYVCASVTANVVCINVGAVLLSCFAKLDFNGQGKLTEK